MTCHAALRRPDRLIPCACLACFCLAPVSAAGERCAYRQVVGHATRLPRAYSWGER